MLWKYIILLRLGWVFPKKNNDWKLPAWGSFSSSCCFYLFSLLYKPKHLNLINFWVGFWLVLLYGKWEGEAESLLNAWDLSRWQYMYSSDIILHTITHTMVWLMFPTKIWFIILIPHCTPNHIMTCIDWCLFWANSKVSLLELLWLEICCITPPPTHHILSRPNLNEIRFSLFYNLKRTGNFDH